MTETRMFASDRDLYIYLKRTHEREIIIRTSYIRACWYDVESVANSAGFMVSRFTNPEYVARHEFSECYRITRRPA